MHFQVIYSWQQVNEGILFSSKHILKMTASDMKIALKWHFRLNETQLWNGAVFCEYQISCDYVV